MISPADLAVLQAEQEAIRQLVLRDLENFWSYVDLSKPERARNALLQYVPLLVRQHGESASAIAAEWYDEVRAAQGVAGAFRALMVESPYLDAVDGAVRRAAASLFVEGHADDALTSLSAAIPKYTLAAGRRTISYSTEQDPRAQGWQRVVRAGACGFCRMLAGRGAVYKQSTVHFASHGSCNCAAAPSWDPSAPEVDVVVYQASTRTTGMSPRERNAHNALIRRAIRQYA